MLCYIMLYYIVLYQIISKKKIYIYFFLEVIFFWYTIFLILNLNSGLEYECTIVIFK